MDLKCQKKISIAVRVFVCFLFALGVGTLIAMGIGVVCGLNIGLVVGLIVGVIAWLLSFRATLEDYYFHFYATWPDFRM